MRCEEATEFISVLCDGETIPRGAAEHIGSCDTCRTRLNAYSTMGAELRRIASLEQPTSWKPGSWKKEQRARPRWWQKGSKTMRIPRFAFAGLLTLILLLFSGLVLVRARTSGGGRVLLLTFRLFPDDPASQFSSDCLLSTDGSAEASECRGTSEIQGGILGMKFRFVSRQGDRTKLAVQAIYKSHSATVNDFRGVPEQMIWIEPGQPQRITVADVGQIELGGEYLDHVPSLRFRPKEGLEPQDNEFRVVDPVLIRDSEVVVDMSDSGNSIDSGDADATLMIYYPGQGRYLISRVPFEGAVEGTVRMSQVRFKLGGQEYLLLTAMPIVQADHVWITHEAQYKLSEHLQGASNDRPMFLVRSLQKLLQPQMQHLM